MSKKIGDDYAREMMRRGLDELRELGHFSGGNVAQPNRYAALGDPGPAAPEKEAAPEPEPEKRHEIERER